MSHFTVAIICDDPQNIQQILAPFQENNMGNCPSEFMSFTDVEAEAKKEWEEEGSAEWYADFRHRLNENVGETIDQIKKDGRYKFFMDDRMDMFKVGCGKKCSIGGHIEGQSVGKQSYRQVFGEIISYLTFNGNEVWELMSEEQRELFSSYHNEDEEELEEAKGKLKRMEIEIKVIDGPKQIPHKEKYPEFNTFMEEWHGYKFDEEQGKYGYWENPNAKWDWWEVGGRWMGSLLIKEGKDGFTGKPGVFGNSVPNTPNGYVWVDSCKVSDVEWEKMAQIKRFELLKNEGEDGDLWDILTDKADIPERKRLDYTFYKGTYFEEKYGSKENYLTVETAFSTYAVITPDGKWHSPGDMGWFGMSSESNEDAVAFSNDFQKNFIEPNKDKTITIVDCHI